MSKFKALNCLAIAGLAGAPAFAQDGADAPAPPPITAPCPAEGVFDDFDFWLGEWNVYAPGLDGQYAGMNVLTKVNGGCLIFEDWASVTGGGGDSMNFYDPLAGAWRQVWVSSGIVIDYTGGLDENGTMLLEGEIFYHNLPEENQRAPFRGMWTPQPDGTVIQHFQQQGANGEWADWFIGHYIRIEDDPRAAEAAEARGE